MLDASEDRGTYIDVSEVRAPPDGDDEEVTGVDVAAPPDSEDDAGAEEEDAEV